MTDTKPSDVDGLIEACAPYLKDGETPAECIARNRRDTGIVLEMLAVERGKVENYAKTMALIDEAANKEATTLAAQQAQLKTVLDREAATIARYDAKLDERDARIEAAIEQGWREGYCAGTYRKPWPLPPNGLEVDEAWQERQERKTRAALKEPS